MTLGKLWSEKRLVKRRLNRKMADEALLYYAAVSAAFNGGDSTKHFNEQIRKLTNGK